MTRDPVCGMQIDEKKAEGKIEYEGQTYFFCSAGCQRRFVEDPKRFARGPRPEPSRG